MNSILQLKGRFEKRPNKARFGSLKLPNEQKLDSKHIEELISQLKNVKEYWIDKDTIEGVLVSVYYSRVVAKSNRLKKLLGDTKKKPVDSICGAKFVTDIDIFGNKKKKHVFTHYVQMSAIDKAINYLEIVLSIIKNDFNGTINSEDTELIAKQKDFKHKKTLKKTNFLSIVLDAFYVEKFIVETDVNSFKEKTIVTIYKTDVETKELLSRIGIKLLDSRIIDGTTLLLDEGQMQILCRKAPYLISMSVSDFTEIDLGDKKSEININKEGITIPKPSNEPVVGVIDTHFDKTVYFGDWVDYHNMLSDEIDIEKEDYVHGTAVSSIIVDGPTGNPELDDGCGRFQVRHFGVSKHNGFSSFAILKLIREIVANNTDIKVWNLSLGSEEPIEENAISPEAAELDKIQNEYDVIFVVAGTNDSKGEKNKKIGAPADSLNSIVVNSVSMKGDSASYSRKGPVLSFFKKPDISYYGGDGSKKEEKIAVCIDNKGASFKAGTSYAAPWITRKLAYLIHIIGFSREIAKALLIDSSVGWNGEAVSDYLGYGVVPKRIEDILQTQEDEIKFCIMGTAEDYETYNYSIPVPSINKKHPFYARAVMCYFPSCDRNQGVDYTGTEMDIQFGRVKQDGRINPINDNKQSEEGEKMYEEEARRIYRKWDNVKRIGEIIKKRPVPKKSYLSEMWGMRIFTKERVATKKRRNLQFGVVITLKEMYGVNRIEEFIVKCMANQWMVNRINIDNKVEIYSMAEEEINFD